MKKIVVLGAAAMMMAACSQIDTGNVMVESSLGQYKSEVLPPGVYFTLFKSTYEISAKEQSLELNDMSPKARDNITIADIDITVYYKIVGADAAKLMIKYAGDLTRDKNGDYLVAHNLVTRTAREAVYNAVSTIPAVHMHTKRAELARMVMENIKNELDASDKGSFEVTNVIIRNIVTDPRLEESIKLAAEMEFNIRRKEDELKLAKAEANRLETEALGQAKANKIIADSLTPTLIELRRIEAMAGFSKSGTHTVVIPQGTNPLINIK